MHIELSDGQVGNFGGFVAFGLAKRPASPSNGICLCNDICCAVRQLHQPLRIRSPASFSHQSVNRTFVITLTAAVQDNARFPPIVTVS